ncbi:MAG: hypothetical protein M0Z60_05790 [Nitrospiraceae bacterium]|nr:hypothetical protein [Nitrospiraceae bacterium]
MKRLIATLFLFSVIISLLGGCTYYYPYDYDRYYYPDNYGFIAPFYYDSPYGYYSFSPYPLPYPYDGYYNYPSPRYYFGESPEEYTERHFQPGGQPGGEK